VFWFVIGFSQELPVRAGEFDRSAIRFEKHKSEQDKVAGLFESLWSAGSAFQQAAKMYREKIAGRSTSLEPEREAIAEGARLATDARDRIARAMGTIEGTSFEDARLQGFKLGLEKDMAHLRDLAARWQQFYFSSALGQKEDALRVARSMDESDMTQAAMAMLTRVRQFSELAQRIQQEHEQDIVEQLNKQRIYAVHKWVAAAGLIYMIGFSIAAAMAIYRRPVAKPKGRAQRRR
jgi:hypothetical protein